MLVIWGHPLADGEAAELQLQRWHDGMVRCPVINFVVTITHKCYASATCVLQCYWYWIRFISSPFTNYSRLSFLLNLVFFCWRLFLSQHYDEVCMKMKVNWVVLNRCSTYIANATCQIWWKIVTFELKRNKCLLYRTILYMHCHI